MTERLRQAESPWSAQDFIWAVGFDSSCIPQAYADQFEWTQHYRFWRQDLAMVAASVAPTCVRYGLPWPLVEPQMGLHDWDWPDHVIRHLTHRLGLNVHVTLMRFGTPLWLLDGVGSVDFPYFMAQYAAQIARRYGDRITTYTVIDEPLTVALFSGRWGIWYPRLRGKRNFAWIAFNLAKAIRLAIEAVRNVQPAAQFVFPEAVNRFSSVDPQLQADVATRNERGFLLLDLLAGKVTVDHPAHAWLLEQGVSSTELRWLQQDPPMLDRVGLNYYPHSEVTLLRAPDGQVAAMPSAAPEGLGTSLSLYHERYKRPVMVTETSFSGSVRQRTKWLDQTLAQVRSARESGVPVAGYTWFPAISTLDWHYGLMPHGDQFSANGLYDLKPDADGTLVRQETPLVALFRHYRDDAAAVIGAGVTTARIEN